MSSSAIATIIIGLFSIAALLAIWCRRDTRGRQAAILVFLLGVPTVWAGTTEMLGHHRPYWTVYDLTAGEYRVLAVKMVQDEGIYLYIDDPARIPPRPIDLPWDNNTAKRLQELMDEASAESKGQFLMRYEPSLDTNALQFHPLPQPPALPPKPPQDQGLQFEQDA